MIGSFEMSIGTKTRRVFDQYLCGILSACLCLACHSDTTTVEDKTQFSETIPCTCHFFPSPVLITFHERFVRKLQTILGTSCPADVGECPCASCKYQNLYPWNTSKQQSTYPLNSHFTTPFVGQLAVTIGNCQLWAKWIYFFFNCHFNDFEKGKIWIGDCCLNIYSNSGPSQQFSTCCGGTEWKFFDQIWKKSLLIGDHFEKISPKYICKNAETLNLSLLITKCKCLLLWIKWLFRLSEFVWLCRDCKNSLLSHFIRINRFGLGAIHLWMEKFHNSQRYHGWALSSLMKSSSRIPKLSQRWECSKKQFTCDFLQNRVYYNM